jgi:hypothetical protein
VKKQYSNIRSTMYKAVLLLSVYCLHLVFFQAAMASSLAPAKYFNTYLSHKANQAKGKPSPASFYIKFIKHANNNGERPSVSPLHILVNAVQVYMPVVIDKRPTISQWQLYSHLPEDAFKLFQRIRVILI